jgi:hypothetical protein
VSARPRLTSHQAEVLERLRRQSHNRPSGWVHLAVIGSRGGLEHLVSKGFAERRTEPGPRGGEHPYYRPVRRAGECWCGAAARPKWTTCTRHYSSGRAR